MSRYIEENDVYKLVEPNGTARVHCSQIDDLPRADVVEVRHGEWVEQIRDYGEYMETEGFKCSVCGYETMDNDKKYCSECGAKMDGERREE